MTDLRTISADDVRARLDDLAGPTIAAPQDSSATKQRWRLREAAVLRGAFAVAELTDQLTGMRTDLSERDVADFVASDVDAVIGADGPAWRLTLEARRSTLAHLRFDPRRLLATTRKQTADPADLGRVMAEAYLSETAPSVSVQTEDQLTGTLIALAWLAGVNVELPTEEQVRARLDLLALLQPLRVVADTRVFGREPELRRIADYVGADVPTRFRPLLVHGPGGIGKSTVVARFLLDEVSQPAGETAFAYLTFDRAELLPQRPLRLLAEILRQLMLQREQISPSAQRVIDALERSQRVVAGSREQAIASRKSSASTSSRYARDEEHLIAEFVNVVRTAQARRVVCVLDTFERAQRQGRAAVDRLWAAFERVNVELPQLRVVMAGRAAISGHDVEDLALVGLTADVALQYLHEHADKIHASHRFLMTVVKRLDGNPLSLRLVADLIQREHPSLRSPLDRHRFLLMLDSERVQGVLYRRVLDHIDDQDVRALAVPGLALRKVSAELVREVLAPSSGLGRISEERAQALYRKLRRETSLVTDHGEYVVHRADVRAEILPVMESAKPKVIASLHRRAVRFYSRRDGVADRTEELYHRLALGQDRKTLDKRWTEEAGMTLDGILDELPPASQAYLATHLGIELDPSIIQFVDDEDWADQAERSARAFLDADDPQAALGVLQVRRHESAMPELDALEAEALARTGDRGAARLVVQRSRNDAVEHGNAADFVRFTLLGAQLEEDAVDFDAALKLLAEARESAQGAGDAVNSLVAGVGMLRVRRRAGLPQDAHLRAEVFGEARGLPTRQRRANPALVRDLAAEGGSELPDYVIAAAQTVGIDVTSENVRTELIDKGHEETVAIVERIIGSSEAAPADSNAEHDDAVSITSSDSGGIVGEYLKQNYDDRTFDAIGEYYQSEADSPSFSDIAAVED